LLERIREITWRHAGIVRNATGLKAGSSLLKNIPDTGPYSSLLTVARLIHECALAREESRGAHFREDFPERGTRLVHSYVSKDQPHRWILP
jgi:L-aspartate oxidase